MLRIFAVGKMKDRRLVDLLDDYLKRSRPMSQVQILEIKDSNKQKEDKELAGLIGSTSGTGLIVAMDERGQSMGSEKFAQLLASQGSISFVIGGPDGLGEQTRALAQRTICLSQMTFTHEMARMLLAEQIYRGLSILRGKPYHRR